MGKLSLVSRPVLGPDGQKTSVTHYGVYISDLPANQQVLDLTKSETGNKCLFRIRSLQEFSAGMNLSYTDLAKDQEMKARTRWDALVKYLGLKIGNNLVNIPYDMGGQIRKGINCETIANWIFFGYTITIQGGIYSIVREFICKKGYTEEQVDDFVDVVFNISGSLK